ncbi:MAG: hypothetical protein JSW15_00150, partial [Deltaproteobacteria bacterium]
MIVKYLFSAPKGDVPIGPDELITPFKITPSENHPFLTLGDYFEAIKEFILKDRAESLLGLLGDHFDKKIRLDRIHKLLIRSEKHGVLYHLASVEFFIDDQTIKHAVSTAISERGKAWLNREYDLLRYMGETFNLPYLPKVYIKGQIEHQVGTRKESLSMFLAEWFEDYHEWHLSIDEKGKGQKLCIWDQQGGHRFATKKESFEIYKQASKILTLYYDTRNYSQIYPWHHAAGDFVVKTKDGKVQVKLTTARKYGPVMAFLEEEQINPLVAIIYFFLNLTIKMRLDKLDGTGEVAWAGDFSVDAAIEGFFESLRIKETQGKYHLGKV